MSKKYFLPNVKINCPFLNFPYAGFDYEVIPWEAKFSLHNFLNVKALFDVVWETLKRNTLKNLFSFENCNGKLIAACPLSYIPIHKVPKTGGL